MIRRILCALLALALLFSLPASAEPGDYLVRLHVIADNDSPEAQAFKLQIRDAVLLKARSLLSRCSDAQSAWLELQAHLSEFLAAATDRAQALGENIPISVQAGVFEFPDRTYGDMFIPAGDYRALRVIIGSGEGENWWCVLFPNLCLPTDGEYHSVVADWLKSLFGGETE